MKIQSEGPSEGNSMIWVRAAALTFGLGFVCGVVLAPLVHSLICGQSDPFQEGWPVCLEVTAFFSSLVIAFSLRCSATVAPGMYLGLVCWMLGTEQAEYPVSAAIGLVLYGFIPGALGAGAAFVVLWARDRVKRPSAMSAMVDAGQTSSLS